MCVRMDESKTYKESKRGGRAFSHTFVRMCGESESTCMRTLQQEKVKTAVLVLGRQPGEPV